MGTYGKHTKATIARDLPRRKSSRVEVRTDDNNGSSTAGALCVDLSRAVLQKSPFTYARRT